MDERLNDLRRHELCRTDRGEQFGRRDGRVLAAAEVDAASETKVADLDRRDAELALAQDVLWF